MPELPEVETVRRTLNHLILNQTIESIDILYASIVENDFSSLIGQSIKEVRRYGKYLIFILEKDAFISHLRMEGKYLYEPSQTPIEKHTHVIFHLTNHMDLRYHDTRKFGRMAIVSKTDYMHQLPLSKLGKEPFDMDQLEFYHLLKSTHMPLKVFLLDQTKICGLGNIYANEVLYRACIHPARYTDTLTKKKANQLLHECILTLNEAIEMGGTTIRSFSSNGIHGLFTQKLYVHGLDGKACPRCQTPIKKEMYKGRSIYYCPKCQPKPRKQRKVQL